MSEQKWEYGFEAPMYGLMYVSTNELLIETMHAARPEAPLYRRPVTEWTRVTSTTDPEETPDGR